MKLNRLHSICCVALLLLGFVSTQVSFAQQGGSEEITRKRYGAGLGRLLTSELERVKLDNQRFNTLALIAPKTTLPKPKAPIALMPPDRWRIDGISNRPSRPQGHRISIWIDGQPYGEGELPKGLSLVRNTEDEVIGMNSTVAKGKIEFAKIGDLITRPQTDAEIKAIEQTADKPAAKPVKL